MRKLAVTGIYRCACLLFMFMLASVAYAEGFVDPTRPANVLDGSSAASASVPVLQSVLIGPGRAEAIINGRTVRVGEKIGDAYVTRIAENEVVLRNGQEFQVLKLFPHIEKRMTYNRVSGTPGKRETEK